MKVWVTKYWETRGIYEVDVFPPISGEGSYVYAGKPGTVQLQLKLYRDAFTSSDDARDYVMKQRDKRVLSLTSKIEALKKMKF